jgi:hypothetical protein
MVQKRMLDQHSVSASSMVQKRMIKEKSTAAHEDVPLKRNDVKGNEDQVQSAQQMQSKRHADKVLSDITHTVKLVGPFFFGSFILLGDLCFCELALSLWRLFRWFHGGIVFVVLLLFLLRAQVRGKGCGFHLDYSPSCH